MPKSSYLHRIARPLQHALPVLNPPRPPLARIDALLLPTAIPVDEVPRQHRTPKPQDDSSHETPSILRPPAFQDRSVREIAPVSFVAESIDPTPSSGKVHPSTTPLSVTQNVVQPTQIDIAHSVSPQPISPETLRSIVETTSIASPEPLAKKRLLPIPVAETVAPALKSRSYLQRVAETSPIGSRPPAAGDALPSPAIKTTVATAPAPKVPIALLQPPNPTAVSSRRESGGEEFSILEPPRGKTEAAAAHQVHIGTIDIQIAPAPPPQQIVVVSQPKASIPLSRGFSSAFGLRQG
jgi:hypothetical protein